MFSYNRFFDLIKISMPFLSHNYMQNNIRTPDVGRKKAAGKQTRVVLLAADN